MEQELASRCPDVQVPVRPYPSVGDNAAMIGAATYPLYLQKSFSPLSLNAKPGLFL